MLGTLLKVIFVPKKARAKLDARTRGASSKRHDDPAKASSGLGRDRLIDQAMAVYRDRRAAYESLDEETRRRIEADAAKAFADALEPKG